jgi:hypothetical protein
MLRCAPSSLSRALPWTISAMNDWIDGENDTSPNETTASTRNIAPALCTNGYVAKPAPRNRYPPMTTARALNRSMSTPHAGLAIRPTTAAALMIAPTCAIGSPVTWWKYNRDNGRYMPAPVASTTMPNM